MISIPGEVTLAQLSLELQEVSDWFGLGLYLGLPPAELHTISYEPTLRCIKDRRMEMLLVWTRKLPGPSWSRVVTALMVIGRETLAYKIALKYGKSFAEIFSCPWWEMILSLYTLQWCTINLPPFFEKLHRSTSSRPSFSREESATSRYLQSGMKLLHFAWGRVRGTCMHVKE